MFKNLILGILDPRIVSNPQSKLIEAAWENFFKNNSRDTTVNEAYQKMTELIPNFPAIYSEVQRILNAPGSPITQEKWIAKRSTELYFKFSDLIHNLKKLNWITDDVDILLPYLPKVKEHDIALVTILHEIMKPLIPTNNPVPQDF